jgi:hypothetical protein
MSKRLTGFTCGIGLLLLASQAVAQVESRSAGEPPDRLEQLSAMVAQLRADSDRLERKLTGDTAALRDEVATLSRGFEELKRRTDLLTDLVNDQRAIVDAISGSDPSGNRVLSLRANMRKSPQFAREVRDAVHDSMSRTGQLFIENQMGSSYELKVNGQYHNIPAYTRSYEVRGLHVGTLTTELVGYESPKNWTLAPPHYVQRIVIAPSNSRYTALRPVLDYPLVYVEP